MADLATPMADAVIAPLPAALSSLQHQPPKKLRDRVIEALRVRHYSLATERAYMAWIRRFVAWSGGRHPRTMGGAEVADWLSWLATDPQAQRVPGSLEQRQVPESADEAIGLQAVGAPRR
jgi:hypothetical protein